MVFVFVKSSYGGKPQAALRSQLKTLLGLVVVVTLYTLGGAVAFQFLSPKYKSQGLFTETDTTFLDSVYFIVVSLTTVGYGDVVPDNDATRLFMSAYILVSMVLVGVALEVTDFLFTVDTEELEAREHDNARMLSRSRRKLLWNMALVVVLIVTVTAFYALVEDFTVVNALWLTVASLSTVGYGDFTPNTQGGRIFCIFWISFGVLLLFRCVGALMDVMLESRKAAWTAAREERENVIRNHLSARVGVIRMVNVSETDAIRQYSKQDLIGVLTKMEFIMYRLEKMGKVGLSDFRALDAEFKGLTPEEISAEFSSEETSVVFSSIIGNMQP